MISSFATQLQPPEDINELSIDEIADYMKSQFDPTKYVVRRSESLCLN